MRISLIGTSSKFFAPDGVGAPNVDGGEPPASSSAPPSGASTTTNSNDAGGTSATPASGGGGVSSPPAVPTSPPPPTPPTPIPSSFEGLEFSDDTEEGDFGFEPTPAPTAPVVPVAPAPVVPPAATPPVQPAAASVAPRVVEQLTGQQGDAALPSPAEPAKIAAAMLANEQAFVDHLAANEFALSQEDLAALETDAPAHIPKLLARMYVKSQMAALNQMQRIVPAMLQMQTKIMSRNAENEGKFYSRWPEISKAQHGERVQQLARTYRQMNPATSLDQMIEDLGPIVMMTARIAPASAQPGAMTPLAPGVRTAPRPAPSPFRPAGTSSSGGVAPQPGAENPWLGLAGASDEDE